MKNWRNESVKETQWLWRVTAYVESIGMAAKNENGVKQLKLGVMKMAISEEKAA
jgi:hypothetical protein